MKIVFNKGHWVVYRKSGQDFSVGQITQRRGTSISVVGGAIFSYHLALFSTPDRAEAMVLHSKLQAAHHEKQEVVRAANDHFNVTVAALLRSAEEGAA